MKLPNGFGSICKLKGKRRNPYIVRVTTGWDENGKQIKKIIGYVKDMKEGLKLLADYHGNPYDLDYRNITFCEVWIEVVKQLEELINKGEMTQGNLNCLSLAYKNHCQPFYQDKLLDLKYKKMQAVVDDIKLSRTTKGYVKTVCVKIFNYAIENYELPLTSNPASKIKSGTYVKSDKHIPFNDQEINIMWEKSHNDIIKTLLIFCYTGMRPNELFEMHRDNIFLDKNYMKGGSKTKAGRDRIIPIHPRIKPFIEYFSSNNSEYPFKEMIIRFNYGKYQRRVTTLMEELNFNHTPYDGRHTFSTRMKAVKADEYLLKRILGHSIQDLTERVYTHRDIEELINEVNKLE